MCTSGTKNCRLIDWMLVLALALALAPLQSAWSAFDSLCQHENDILTAYDSHLGHASITHASQNRDSGSSTAGNCCCHTQDNDGAPCTDNCQQVPAALYLPPLKLTLYLEVFTDFEIQHPNLSNGRTVPPPHQPPRS